MINIPILDWGKEADIGIEDPYIIRLPYLDIDTIELVLTDYFAAGDNIYGILSPYSPENVEFNIRSAARIRDRFPEQKIYVAVPVYKTYERLKTIFRAGFSNIVVPFYLGGVQYDHYFQFIQADDLDKMTLHVAGGKFSSDTWNKENWTWSREVL